jgi:predicted nucleic acid-binding protein
MGEGERAAITLAYRLGFRLLVDDKAARQYAALQGIHIIGTAGVLVEAKRKRLVRRVKPLIEELQKGGYRLSDELVQRVLTLCHEDR